MKRPSFQFYPGDWQNDTKLKLADWEVKGLWMDLLCLMHNDSHYGYLCIGDRYLDVNEIQRVLNANPKRFHRVFKLIETLDIIRHDGKGFYSKRMVEDERVRRIRAESGSKGGNPNLVNQKLNQNSKQNLTPSSSSSSSSSILDRSNREKEIVTVSDETEKLKSSDKKKRASQVSENFQLSEQLMKWLEEKKISPEWAQSEIEGFVDFYKAKGTTFIDWKAAFQNWCRKGIEYGRLDKWSAINHRTNQLSLNPSEQPLDNHQLLEQKIDKMLTYKRWRNKWREDDIMDTSELVKANRATVMHNKYGIIGLDEWIPIEEESV